MLKRHIEIVGFFHDPVQFILPDRPCQVWPGYLKGYFIVCFPCKSQDGFLSKYRDRFRHIEPLIRRLSLKQRLAERNRF